MESLAARIKELIWEYSPYEFGDAFSNDMDAIDRIEHLLDNQEGIDIITSCLDDMSVEMSEMARETEGIKKIIEEMGRKVQIDTNHLYEIILV